MLPLTAARPRWLRLVRCSGVALALIWFFAGCRTAPAPASEPFKTAGWEDHRLANSPRPYDKLLVEIDAVEGAEPRAEELADIKAFLERTTNKPGGVIVKRDNLIPLKIARQRTPESLALEYLNGPTDDHTAFIYILSYRSRLTQLFKKPENPYFTYFPCPCVVFVNRSYGPFFDPFHRAKMRRVFLQHEIGHALGLTRNPAHSKDGHCTNPNCLMQSGLVFNVRRFLTFRDPWGDPVLCADCLRDLENYKTVEAKPNERLWHAYFRHDGDGYQLLTLPGFGYVHFGDPAGLSLETIAEERGRAIEAWKQVGNDPAFSLSNFAFGFKLPEDEDAIVRFVEQEKELPWQYETAKRIFEVSLTQAEAVKGTDREQARAYVSAKVVAAAADFPELQARLKALHDELSAPVAADAVSPAAPPAGEPKR